MGGGASSVSASARLLGNRRKRSGTVDGPLRAGARRVVSIPRCIEGRRNRWFLHCGPLCRWRLLQLPPSAPGLPNRVHSGGRDRRSHEPSVASGTGGRDAGLVGEHAASEPLGTVVFIIPAPGSTRS